MSRRNSDAVVKVPPSAVVLRFPEISGVRGDAVFDEFVRRHHDELLRYLHSRLSNPHDVADLAQECFTRLLRYREGHSEDELKLLLFRLANNLLTDAWRVVRTHRLENHVPLESLELTDPARSQEEALDARQRLAQLKAVIEQLPPKCQAVFLMSRFEGMSHEQIARKCAISLKAVEKHIARALSACRRVDTGEVG